MWGIFIGIVYGMPVVSEGDSVLVYEETNS